MDGGPEQASFRLAPGEVREGRYLVRRRVGSLDGQPQPPRARFQLGPMLADHAEVIHHQLDKSLLARADAGLAADTDEQRLAASWPFPGHRQIVHRAVSALLEPDPHRGHVVAKTGDRAFQQQFGEQRTAVGVFQHHAPAASGVRARIPARAGLIVRIPAPCQPRSPMMLATIRRSRGRATAAGKRSLMYCASSRPASSAVP